MSDPFPDWCPKACGWRHRPEVPCPKTKLPMPIREPGMEPGQELGPRKMGNLLAAQNSTLHEVEAHCPVMGCGVVRKLMIYAPPEKLVMDRICNECQQGPRPVVPERTASLPYKDPE